jgi:predicted acyl esterase
MIALSTEATGREVEENIEVNIYVPGTQGTTPTLIQQTNLPRERVLKHRRKSI